MDRLYKVSGNGFMEFYKRELGFSPPRTFSRHISASEVSTSFFYLIYLAVDVCVRVYSSEELKLMIVDFAF